MRDRSNAGVARDHLVDAQRQAARAIATQTAQAVSITALQAQPVPRAYSTVEQAVGINFLGAPVYQKTIAFGAGPGATEVSTSHGISPLVAVVKIEGAGTNGSLWIPVPNPAGATSGLFELFARLDGSKMYLDSTGDYSAWAFAVTVFYTKS